MPRSKYFRSMSRYGRISCSRMRCQMIRVISSPSISTTGFFTLIFATPFSSEFATRGSVSGTGLVSRTPTSTERRTPKTEQRLWHLDRLARQARGGRGQTARAGRLLEAEAERQQARLAEGRAEEGDAHRQ